MNIVYMGTPDFSVFSLEKLNSSNYIKINRVVTQPDRPRGRGQKLEPTAVKKKALEMDLQVFQSKNINTKKFIKKLKIISPDAIVVVAFGQKLSKEILNIPKYGCINLHGSLLPEYRGASPIHQAILDGKKITGVTTMYMAEGWDTGDMIYKKELKIEKTDTVGILHDKMAELGAELLLKTLIDIEKGIAPRERQDHNKASYTSKIDKSTGEINWNFTSEKIYNQVRGTNPWPGAYTYYQGELLKIWQLEIKKDPEGNFKSTEPGTIVKADNNNGLLIKTGDGFVEIIELQLPGRKRISVKDMLHGYNIKIDEILG